MLTRSEQPSAARLRLLGLDVIGDHLTEITSPAHLFRRDRRTDRLQCRGHFHGCLEKDLIMQASFVLARTPGRPEGRAPLQAPRGARGDA